MTPRVGNSVFSCQNAAELVRRELLRGTTLETPLFLSTVSELATPGVSASIGSFREGNGPPPLTSSMLGDSMTTAGADIDCGETGQSTRDWRLTVGRTGENCDGIVEDMSWEV